MRIVFSVYTEDHETGEVSHHFSELIQTDLSVQEIDGLLQLYDLFHSELIVGHTLSFWDIYCFGEFHKEIIARIKQIPLSDSDDYERIEPRLLRIDSFDPCNAEAPFYPEIKDCYFYRISRYECGASGFETLAVFFASDPVACGLFVNSLYDCIKFLPGIICGLLRQKSKAFDQKPKVVKLNERRFYKEFCAVTNLDKFNCQMIKLEPLDSGAYEIHVRTVKNECYKVISDSRGNVRSFDMENKGNEK